MIRENFSLRKKKFSFSERYLIFSDNKRKKGLSEKINNKRFSVFNNNNFDGENFDLNFYLNIVINESSSFEKIVESLKNIRFFLVEENCEIDSNILLENLFKLMKNFEKKNLDEIIIYIFDIFNIYYENETLKNFLLENENFARFFHNILHKAIVNFDCSFSMSNDFVFLISNVFKFYNFLNLLFFDLFLKSFKEKILKKMLEIVINKKVDLKIKFEVLKNVSDFVSNKNENFTFYLKKCEIYSYLIILFENSEIFNNENSFLKEMFFLLCNLIVGEYKNYDFIFNSCIINKIFFYLNSTKNVNLKIEIFWCCAQLVNFDNKFFPILIEKNFLKNVIYDCLSLKQSRKSKVFFCVVEAVVEILKIFLKNKKFYEKYFYQIVIIKNKMEEIYLQNENNDKINQYLIWGMKKIEKFENLIN